MSILITFNVALTNPRKPGDHVHRVRLSIPRKSRNPSSALALLPTFPLQSALHGISATTQSVARFGTMMSETFKNNFMPLFLRPHSNEWLCPVINHGVLVVGLLLNDAVERSVSQNVRLNVGCNAAHLQPEVA